MALMVRPTKKAQVYLQAILARKNVTIPFTIQTVTVGTGISPVHARRLADYTAGGELHPAPKVTVFSYT